jgi:dienelactone hydrolase
MTSQDRELAIADNVAYVRNVVAQFPAARRIVFAGFSQGVAMAYRAAAAIPTTAVIALGGDVPPDVIPVARSLPPVLVGRGVRD